MRSKRITAPDPLALQGALLDSGSPKFQGNCDKLWKRIEEWVAEAANKVPKPNNSAERQHWTRDETLALVGKKHDIRHAVTDFNKHRFQEENNDIKHACSRDKNKHINGLCAELKRHTTKNSSKGLYGK